MVVVRRHKSLHAVNWFGSRTQGVVGAGVRYSAGISLDDGGGCGVWGARSAWGGQFYILCTLRT